MEIEVAAELPLMDPLAMKAEEAAAAAAAAATAEPKHEPHDGLQELLEPAAQPAAAAAAIAPEPAGPEDEAAAGDAGGGGAAASGSAAAGAAGADPEADELAANLLSNMAAWQTELDSFQSVLKRCMEIKPRPGMRSQASAGLAGGHSGPKGITGFRGVTQHKRTKRYEANVWMDHKQMYLGAFDVPEEAAHAHDIGALCSGKARPDSLNFPLSDYEQLLPLLSSLPHAQVVAALRGYGRLPTARPSAVSSGRALSSPGGRGSKRSRAKDTDTDDDSGAEEGGSAQPRARPRRARKPTAAAAASPGGARLLGRPGSAAWQAGSSSLARTGSDGPASTAAIAGLAPATAASASLLGPREQPTPASIALAQQAQLQALEAALMGSPGALAPGPRPASATADTGLDEEEEGQEQDAAVTAFEAALSEVMERAHLLDRPADAELLAAGSAARPMHSGPKGQSGFKGVTLYKRCQRFNAHIWLGKQTHIGTFHSADQAAVAHDVMELWRSPTAQGLNFDPPSYYSLLPLLRALTEADALATLRAYSRSPAAAAAAAASGVLPIVRPIKAASVGRASGASKWAAPREPAAAAAQAPSLRKRQRKPQHVPGAGGSSGAASDDSASGGSAPAAPPVTRQSAGQLMWYMLEQEKEDEELGGDSGDPDFSPAADGLDVAPSKGARRQDSPSFEPLSFAPRATPSVSAALGTEIAAGQAILGARPPRPGSSHRWGVAVSLRGQAGWFGRLDRQRAAVAADVSLAWRRLLAEEDAEKEGVKAEATPPPSFNVPSAAYEQDAALVEQLKRIRTAPQLCQFLAAVVPQDPPAAPGTAAAAAAAAEAQPGRPLSANIMPVAPAPLAGARKRKQHASPEDEYGVPLPRSRSGTPAIDGAGAGEPQQQQAQQQGAASSDALAGAALAVAAANTSDSQSMLSALRLVAAAGKGGSLLQQVVAGWAQYSDLQQQDLFGALQLPASTGDWEQAEGRLQVALDLASLF